MNLFGIYISDWFIAILLFGLVLIWLSIRRRGLDPWSRKQLKDLKKSHLTRKRIMGVEEYKLYKVLQMVIKSTRQNFYVYPQVSLGELIEVDTNEGFRAINSKRADFVITDAFGWPVILVEYQGGAHFQGNAMGRDLVKQTAATYAGIAFLAVFEDYEYKEVKEDVFELLELPLPPKGKAATSQRV